MPTPAPTLAKPSKHVFDPFNSSATGHQRADNRLSGSTSWRDSRSRKLQSQFSAGTGGDGGKRISDTVGAGSLDFGRDGRTESGGWVRGAPGLRAKGQRSLWEFGKVEKPCNSRDNEDETERAAKKLKREHFDELRPTSIVNPFTPLRREDGSVRETSWTAREASQQILDASTHTIQSLTSRATKRKFVTTEGIAANCYEPSPEQLAVPQIFTNLVFYINGSTLPIISDHKLKYMLTAHGGQLSVALGRRTVTHVILGVPNACSSRADQPGNGNGSGGGLAATKIQKEIARVGGKNVRYVRTDWVVESVCAGKRLPESRFEAMNLAPKGVASITSAFGSGTRE